MEHFSSLSDHFLTYAEVYGYWGIYFWFLIVDTFSPIPDEISLITVGYLCAIGVLGNPIIAGIASLVAFLTVDFVEFFFSSKGSKFTSKYIDKLPTSWKKRLKNGLKKQLPKTLLFLSFIPRMRIFAPFIAGTVGVSPKRYFFFDFASLSLFVVIYVSLGYFFLRGVINTLNKIGEVNKHIFFIIFIAFILLLSFILFRKKIIKKKI